MGVMNKLRENTGVILWILVISFGIIWVLQDSGAFDVVGRTGDTIAEVNGDPISYQEYVRAVEAQMQAYQQQTGEAPTPQMSDLIREQVFNALVEERLREQAMERLGITVTDDEVVQMVLGDNPHPIIKAYFGDENGNVNRALLQNFIDNPAAREDWIRLEEYLRAERARQKLEQLLLATVRVSDQEVEEEYRRRTLRADARYVALRYAEVPDDSVTVTESDLRRYYNEHRDDFQRKRTYRVAYVTLPKNPTAEDTSQVLEELNRLKERFAQTENDSLFLARYASERPFTDAFFRRDELDPALGDVVFDDPQPGKVVGPVVAGGLAHLVKIRAVRPSEETVIRARHILIRAPEDNPEARQQARQEALELKRQLEQGADFATLAREHSDDPGSARRGGDLGWFGRGRMVEPFEEAAFSAPIGRVVGPVETRFGYHLIEVTGRSSVEVQIADLAMRPAPSLATLNRIQERMEDLAYYAEESGDFEGEAQRMGLQVQEMRVEEDQQFLPGIGQSRAVLNFLAGADEGDVSQVIELDDRFIVLQLVEVIPKGYRSFEEVREEIRPRVLLEKKKEVQVARMRRALQQHGFDGLAEALGTTVQTVTQLSYNQTLIPGLGREPRFVGTVFGLQEGETSGVVEGENAAFVVQLAKLYEPPPLGEQMREQIRQQLLNQRRQQVLTQWLAALREQADIKDYRRRFEL
ncbi:PpiC-type peptidyl-prolyl cis-trans isomerase [Rhodothermus marinus SG0.5JP17-172]|uniref:peptidylprolyl isomerase n=1 Tax=Rhodothermus marinus TaxID=29549 RepID=UPI000223DA39|nr:peptidylprolyl isomerase [Rhodothermus marinus]AEN74028.1 PpiC-type peptidyl-prolyl cis-trans isomerase [Rhodothermus marinus SG0.5JP17-172]MBO2490995.1 peptidylprolyl isomerase [Rhodothermus marinus]